MIPIIRFSVNFSWALLFSVILPELLFTPRHSQNRAFSAFRCCAAHFCVCKTQCSLKWRSRPTFMQADFHARQKKAHKNVRVNSNLPGCNSCVHSYEYILFRTKISQHEYMKRVPFSSFSQKRPEASSFAAITLMDFFESFYCI